MTGALCLGVSDMGRVRAAAPGPGRAVCGWSRLRAAADGGGGLELVWGVMNEEREL